MPKLNSMHMIRFNNACDKLINHALCKSLGPNSYCEYVDNFLKKKPQLFS